MLMSEENDTLYGGRLLREYIKSRTQKVSPKLSKANDSQTLENSTDIRLSEVLVNGSLN